MEDRYYSRIIKIGIFLIDIYFIHIVLFNVNNFRFVEGIPQDQYTTFFLIFSLVWIITGLTNEIYKLNKYSLIRSISLNLFSTLLLHGLLIGIILMSVPSYHVSIDLLATTYIIIAIFFIGSRITYKLIWKYFEFYGYELRQVIIVGATRSGMALQEFFVSDEFSSYRFKGFFDDSVELNEMNKNAIKGRINDVKEFCLREKVDEIYFALPLSNHELLWDLAKFADDNFIYFRIAPDFAQAVSSDYNVFLYDTVPVLTTRKEPLSLSINAGLKRLFDITFSLGVILTIFPVVIPIVALAIRLESKGPVIFKQLRPGKKNKLFECYKFRTMYVNKSTEVQATKHDPRVTRVGRFLRKTNLDELPQFVNVLLGNMSVVGPRPNMISQLEEYSTTIQKYKVRHFVMPGITGYAQINGFRGETREPGLMEKRVEYDVKYMENWSLLLDVKIIILTVWNMIRGEKNAY